MNLKHLEGPVNGTPGWTKSAGALVLVLPCKHSVLVWWSMPDANAGRISCSTCPAEYHDVTLENYANSEGAK